MSGISVWSARQIGAALLILAIGLAAGAAMAAEVRFELRIERGQVPAKMRRIRVKQGDIVKLRWSADRPLVLHLHGYDIETKVEPGKTAAMDFTARATGRFSIEEHKSRGSGSHSHGTPIVQIEVYPR